MTQAAVGLTFSAGEIPARPGLGACCLEWVARYRRWLLAAVGVLFLVGFNGQWRMGADTTLYVALGDNIAQGRGYSFGGVPHTIAFPLVPWMTALGYKLAPAHPLWPPLVLMVVMGLLTLGAIYRCFRLHAGVGVATAVTLLCGVNSTLHRFAFEMMTDLPFLLGTMMCFAGYEGIRRRIDGRDASDGQPRTRPATDWLLLGGGVGLAILSRPTIWVLLGVVALELALQLVRRRGVARHLMIGLVILLCVGAFVAVDPRRGAREQLRQQAEKGNDAQASAEAGRPGDRKYFQGIIERLVHWRTSFKVIFGENLPSMLKHELYDATFGEFAPRGMAVWCSVVVLAGGTWLFRRRAMWGAYVIGSAVVILFASLLARYFLMALPLLAYAWLLAALAAERRMPSNWGRYVFGGMMVLWLAPNAYGVGRLIAEQHREPFLVHYQDGMYQAVSDLAKLIEEKTEPGSMVVIRRHARVLWYLSGRATLGPGDLKRGKAPPEVVYRRLTSTPKLYVVISGVDAQVGDEDDIEFTPDTKRDEGDEILRIIKLFKLRLGPPLGAVNKGTRARWSLHEVRGIVPGRLPASMPGAMPQPEGTP